MQMEEISDSNYLCECLVLASAASLRHLRLDPDDATSKSYVRMFTAVAGTLATLDCRTPGDHWDVLVDGIQILTALEQLTLSIEAFAGQAVISALAAMTTRNQLRTLTLGPEEWPAVFIPKKPDGGQSGYGDVLLQLAKSANIQRVQIGRGEWLEYNHRATRHSPAAMRDLARFTDELAKRKVLLELIK